MRASADVAIEVRDLVKRYGERTAVDGLTLTVERGETLALLGPNGAGKTTTVEILEGYRRSDGGNVRVLNCDPIADAARLKPRIGVMLQESGLYPTITPREALELFSRFYPHPRAGAELLALVGLEESAGIRYRRLSGGQKQRLSLALALLPRPEVVFLDEPTAGLDPRARRATWDIIEGLGRDGVTVLLTTHYLDEAEYLADRVAIIDNGRLVALDTPAALVGSGTAVRLRVSGPVDEQALIGLASVTGLRRTDQSYVLDTADPPACLVEVTALLRDLGAPIIDLRVGQGSLEDVYLERTGKVFES